MERLLEPKLLEPFARSGKGPYDRDQENEGWRKRAKQSPRIQDVCSNIVISFTILVELNSSCCRPQLEFQPCPSRKMYTKQTTSCGTTRWKHFSPAATQQCTDEVKVICSVILKLHQGQLVAAPKEGSCYCQAQLKEALKKVF